MKALRSLPSARSSRHGSASSQSGAAAIALVAALVILAIILILAYRSTSGGETGSGQAGEGAGESGQSWSVPSAEDTLRRERVAVFYAKSKHAEAKAELQPLLDVDTPNPDDLVRGAQIALRVSDWATATDYLDRALAIAPDHPAALYSRARVAALDYDVPAARAGFERVLELVPTDPATKIELAMILLEDDEPDVDRVRTLLEDVAGLGRENGLLWFVTAVYRRWRFADENDEGEEVTRQWLGLYESLQEQGFKPAKEPTLDQGSLALVAPPRPEGTYPAAKPKELQLADGRRIMALPDGTTDFQIHDMNGDRTPDVLTVANGELAVHLRERGKPDVSTTVLIPSGVTGPFCVLDLNQRRSGDTLDVVAITGETLTIIEQADEAETEEGEPIEPWTTSPVAVPTPGGAITDVVPVDYDHEGELDLLIAGEFGARILRNDGVGARVNSEGELQPRGAWVDASETATLPTEPMTWCAAEDFDGDNDVDFIVGGPGGAQLLDSQRRGLFTDRAEAAFGGRAFPRKPTIADVNGDRLPDLFVPDDKESTLLLQGPAWSFTKSGTFTGVPAGQTAVATDLDFDGSYDLLWAGDGALGAGILAAGLPIRTPVDFGQLAGASGPLRVDEIDSPDPYGELALELLRVQNGALVATSPEPSMLGNAVYLKFIGRKDNRQGVGAIVEVRAGAVYSRTFWDGDAAVIGLGGQKYADVVRVSWPNGVVQQELDVEAGVAIMLDNPSFGVQPEGLIGSCPFLYTWNGEAFEFISDVIGITPLGLPMAPGMLVPPDHDEYVLVRGNQLKPDSNGQLVMQFTEELREVTYLDRVRLDVIDHPAGTDVYPNERFCFPPFPEPHTHIVERVAKVQSALGSDGADWTLELQEKDMRHPAPFTRLAGQFLGLAEPHWLELEFNPDDLKGAELIRLVATGWFYWSDASVNVAAAGTPGVDFVPPTIEVQNEAGDWVPAGPPVGFPAGKTKTMVIDVTSMISKEAPRFRIGSTLELYWDQIELAVCNDDAEIWTKSLEPVSTELWSRGFSEPIVPEREDMPLFFDWNQTTEEPRWDQHPGLYTKYGAVDELVSVVDDRYVIMGSGDALTIRFDAADLPDLPEGYVRDYLVFLDGWAKDRDPNTYEALEVEPLPFHAMSGYPYPASESFPDTPEMQAWRKEWNTRPAHRWIVPLSAAREKEWVQEAIALSRSKR